MHFCVMSFAETSTPFSIVFCPRCRFFHFILPEMHFFVMYFAETSTPFSIALDAVFFHYILPGMHFFVMYFAATSTPFSSLFCPESVFLSLFFAHSAFFRNVFCRNKPLRLSLMYFALDAIFFHYILPGMHFFVMYFAATSTPFSILFYPESVFFSLYFDHNAYFRNVFCRNLYTFLHCILP